MRIVLDFHSAPAERRNFFFYSDSTSTSLELYAEITAVMDAAQRTNPDFLGVSGSIEMVVGEGREASTWSFHELGTHGLTIESSGNDVSYGPNEGEQQTIERLLALGETIGVSVAEVLFDVR